MLLCYCFHYCNNLFLHFQPILKNENWSPTEISFMYGSVTVFGAKDMDIFFEGFCSSRRTRRLLQISPNGWHSILRVAFYHETLQLWLTFLVVSSLLVNLIAPPVAGFTLKMLIEDGQRSRKDCWVWSIGPFLICWCRFFYRKPLCAFHRFRLWFSTHSWSMVYFAARLLWCWYLVSCVVVEKHGESKVGRIVLDTWCS